MSERIEMWEVLSLVLLLPASIFWIATKGTWEGWVMLGMIIMVIYDRIYPKQYARVELDGAGIRRVRGGQICEQVLWDDLTKITIMTTDEGPFAEDFFFMFYGAEGGVLVPNGQACEMDLLSFIGALPGFDHMAVVVASGSADWAEFECWSGSGAKAAMVAHLDAHPELDDKLLTMAFSS